MADMTNEVPSILILSHGPLCAAMLESASMIAGDFTGVTALPFQKEDNPEEYARRAIDLYKQMPQGSIVLFDLFSGTPFNQMMQHCGGKVIHGLCGASLPMLLDALSMRECMAGEELIKAIEQSAHASVVNVGEFMAQALQEE